MKICFKVCLFVIIFFVLSLGLAFFLKDDANSYSRALTHEFYKQDNIDILFCGASHVSHGIDTRVSDASLTAILLTLEHLLRELTEPMQ